MDLYAKVRELDARVRAGEETLLSIQEEMRRILGARPPLRPEQLANAIAPNDETPTEKRRKKAAVASPAIPTEPTDA